MICGEVKPAHRGRPRTKAYMRLGSKSLTEPSLFMNHSVARSESRSSSRVHWVHALRLQLDTRPTSSGCETRSTNHRLQLPRQLGLWRLPIPPLSRSSFIRQVIPRALTPNRSQPPLDLSTFNLRLLTLLPPLGHVVFCRASQRGRERLAGPNRVEGQMIRTSRKSFCLLG